MTVEIIEIEGSGEPPQVVEIAIPGARGPQGAPGDPGENGADGLPGADGQDGAPGAAGAAGAKGDKGDKGDTGNAGAAGAAGPKGDKGDPGDDGQDGAPGAAGAAGAKGDPGDDGEDGVGWIDGGLSVDPSTVPLGTLTVDSGLVYVAQADGWSYLFSIVGPQGEPGAGSGVDPNSVYGINDLGPDGDHHIELAFADLRDKPILGSASTYEATDFVNPAELSIALSDYAGHTELDNLASTVNDEITSVHTTTDGLQAEIDSLSANKADLVDGLVPLSQLPPGSGGGDSGDSVDIKLPLSLAIDIVGTTASSEQSSGESAVHAFDKTSTSWLANATTGWIQAELDEPAHIVQYLVSRREDNPGRNPAAWTFEGGDGVTWDVLDTQTGITWPDSGEIKIFTCDGTDAYVYFRMNITANNGDGSYVSVQELTLVRRYTVGGGGFDDDAAQDEFVGALGA